MEYRQELQQIVTQATPMMKQLENLFEKSKTLFKAVPSEHMPDKLAKCHLKAIKEYDDVTHFISNVPPTSAPTPELESFVNKLEELAEKEDVCEDLEKSVCAEKSHLSGELKAYCDHINTDHFHTEL